MSFELIRHFADLMPDATLLVSGGGVIVAANRAAGRLFGKAPLALRDRPIAEFVADKPEVVAAYLKTCSKTREKVLGRLQLRQISGEELPCRSEGAVLQPASEQAEALLMLRVTPRQATVSQFIALNQQIEALGKEINRRTHAEQELREQRKWLSVTLASIGDAVIATDNDGRVIFMNRVAEELTGWPHANANGRHLDDVFRIINEETRLPVENPVAKALRVGTIVGLANHTILIARDGSEYSIDDTAAPIREEGGEIKGVVLIFHDIGDRRKLERELHDRAERLVEADRRKDEFLAMLAHELRNPLASVKNAIQLLRMPNVPTEHADWSKEIIERQVKHLARLIDDLLDVSRITRGKIELRRERIDASPVINSAVDAVRPLIEERKQELAVSFTPGTLWCEVDPTRLEQTLINLLTNAAKYSGAGGHIRLTARHDGEHITFIVKDDGIGIPPDKLSEMFELFAQGDRTIARSEGGLGIGLTIVRRIAELHGGNATAFSEGSGMGSEFTVTLPAIPQPKSSPTRTPGAGPQPRRCSRILIVDDNVDLAHGLARLLKLLGNDIRTAHDGQAAVSEALTFQPEFILLDIGLLGMDGYQVARKIRQEGFDDAVIIAISGYGQEDDRLRSREAGFNHHLVKPVDYNALITLIGHPDP
jgi:PAS domain S-box-containing protein